MPRIGNLSPDDLHEVSKWVWSERQKIQGIADQALLENVGPGDETTPEGVVMAETCSLSKVHPHEISVEPPWHHVYLFSPLTSSQCACGQIVAWWKYSSEDTEGGIAN